MSGDPRHVAIERALRSAALALLTCELSRDQAVRQALTDVAIAMGDAGETTATPREIAAAGRQAHRKHVVAEIVRLENDGRGRSAASILARSFAVDVDDLREVETLRNKFARWRRLEQKRALAHLRCPDTETPAPHSLSKKPAKKAPS